MAQMNDESKIYLLISEAERQAQHGQDCQYISRRQLNGQEQGRRAAVHVAQPYKGALDVPYKTEPLEESITFDSPSAFNTSKLSNRSTNQYSTKPEAALQHNQQRPEAYESAAMMYDTVYNDNGRGHGGPSFHAMEFSEPNILNPMEFQNLNSQKLYCGTGMGTQSMPFNLETQTTMGMY